MKPRFTIVAVLAVACALILAGPPCRAAGRDLSLVPSTGPLAHQTIYANSYALLIGINTYENLPGELHLHYAVADAMSMRDMLIRYYGFPADHIRMLLDKDATRHNIIDALADYADQTRYHTNDRILIFFSGHGQTVDLPGGGNEGFLIPVDATVDLNNIENAAPFLKSCIQMEEIWDYLKSTPAKHVLLIADACYSGLLTQNRALGISSGALAALASKRALQVMTAGGQGETSSEMSTYGHGTFTYKLLEELKARAQTPGDVFTTSELYAAVERSVADATNGAQDPQFGNYKTEGDFLFIPTKPQKVPELAKVATVEPEPSTDDDHDHTYTPPVTVHPHARPSHKADKYTPRKYGANMILIVPFSGTAQYWQNVSTAIYNEMASDIPSEMDGYSVPNYQQVQMEFGRLGIYPAMGYLSLDDAAKAAKGLGARYVVMGQIDNADEKYTQKNAFLATINRYEVHIKCDAKLVDIQTGDVIAELNGESKKSANAGGGSFLGQPVYPTVQNQAQTRSAADDAVKDAADQMVDSIKDALGGGSDDAGDKSGDDSSN